MKNRKRPYTATVLAVFAALCFSGAAAAHQVNQLMFYFDVAMACFNVFYAVRLWRKSPG